MMVQECASHVLLVGRNAAKGEMAARIINENASQEHCKEISGFVSGRPPAVFRRANVRNRTEVRGAFAHLAELQRDSPAPRIDAVVNAAGIAGWSLIGLPDVPDDAWLGEQDAIANNLYGTINVMAEAMRFWRMERCASVIGQPSCPSLGYTPAIVNVASMQALTGAPTMLMYGASKAGIVSATRSVAQAYPPPTLRANVVAPGLIDTPLTWNQVRSFRLNGTVLTHPYPTLQTSFQCILEGKLRSDGDCPGGGKGSPCAAQDCADIFREDPRVDAMFKPLLPLVDPRIVGETILHLASTDGNGVTGETVVVDKNSWSCPTLEGPPLSRGQCCAPSPSKAMFS
jgi:NAD(P)-dependent dehydrogenase (short-subunit alcohol dehydrogenase family)